MSPRDATELAALLAARSAHTEKVERIDLSQLNRVLEAAPEDMTVSVEAGISLAALQQTLGEQRQWLPIDPPNPNVSIHEILSRDLSGPRRFGYGTIREHLIGMKVVLADGRLIKSGGKVVKNVAGYDLARLFIGARDSLGIIVEATFKVRPLPALEHFVRTPVPLEEFGERVRAILDSPLTPVVLDAHSPTAGNGSNVALVLGFAGTAQEVEWQLATASTLGFDEETTPGYEQQFWNNDAPVNCVSVLPSRLAETLRDIGLRPFVARAGNGVVYYGGEHVRMAKQELPLPLMQRVKAAYDPKNILPEFTA